MDWIKVTPETMPKEGQRVNVTYSYHGGEGQVAGEFFREHGEWIVPFGENGYEIAGEEYDVTHWCPYPEPAED